MVGDYVAMDIQKRYWRFLVQIKAWIFYLDVYAESSYKWDRRINIFTAITSSASIAAWTIWSKYNFIWGAIIAVSQIVSAIKQYLPYSKRLEIIRPFIADLQLLFTKADYMWFKVANGELTENEINEELFSLKKRYAELEQKHLKQNSLVENKKFRDMADQKTDEYFTSNYC